MHPILIANPKHYDIRRSINSVDSWEAQSKHEGTRSPQYIFEPRQRTPDRGKIRSKANDKAPTNGIELNKFND